MGRKSWLFISTYLGWYWWFTSLKLKYENNRNESKNCKNCPFSTYEVFENNATCYAPVEIHIGNYNIKSYYKDHKRSKWCPLTLDGIKISLWNGKTI